HIEERQKYSPLVGAWYSELGSLNTWIHMWAYESYDQRAQVRAETREKGVWPPPGGIAPLKQENKLLLPLSVSPLQ
ncbi:MAG: NIPSNAP family protein, partial [Dehalococcoidia bacterium]|nr:NIPSNAP family protein [Dehalococcoidia bacterium]